MRERMHDTLKERLEALDRRLQARKRELKDRGEFADVHELIVADARRRQAEIRRRLDTLLEHGLSWSLLKSELELDLNGLIGTLLDWQERLDAETNMKITSQ